MEHFPFLSQRPFFNERDQRQMSVAKWCAQAFGIEQAASVPQRALRLLEEATEAAQAAGVTKEEALRVIEYVFSRPKGNLFQEMGGVEVTALALCYADGFPAEDAARAEVDRILSKPLDHFRKRNKAKNDAGLKAGA